MKVDEGNVRCNLMVSIFRAHELRILTFQVPTYKVPNRIIELLT